MGPSFTIPQLSSLFSYFLLFRPSLSPPSLTARSSEEEREAAARRCIILARLSTKFLIHLGREGVCPGIAEKEERENVPQAESSGEQPALRSLGLSAVYPVSISLAIKGWGAYLPVLCTNYGTRRLANLFFRRAEGREKRRRRIGKSCMKWRFWVRREGRRLQKSEQRCLSNT